MSELDQYQDFTTYKLDDLIKRTDSFVKSGYKIMSTIPIPPRGQLGGGWLRTMYLSKTLDIGKYADFMNIPIGDPSQAIVEDKGYTAIASYSKHITWAVKKDDSSTKTVE